MDNIYLNWWVWYFAPAIAFLLTMMFGQGTRILYIGWRTALVLVALAAPLSCYLVSLTFSLVLSAAWTVTLIFAARVILQGRANRAEKQLYQLTKTRMFGSAFKKDPELAARMVGGRFDAAD